MNSNILTLTDSYKFSHFMQYPPGATRVHSYFEARTGARFPETVFFGLQYFLKAYLAGRVVTREKIAQAKELCDAHIRPGLFNEGGWMNLLAKHDGRLPVVIRAVPEGRPVPASNVLMTIENTDPDFPWLPNYLETLLVQVWYPSTVASQSREMKKVIKFFLDETGDPDVIDFKLHDFGFRGVSSVESAGIGGAGHLVNFKGTDTVRALEVVRDFYRGGVAGFSIPASEHSTITSWGERRELDAMRNMLDQYPTGLVACVSDSWDIYHACQHYWGGDLRDRVLARDGVLVVRPDSGDPTETLPKILDILGERFGYKTNDKGYKVLDPHIRVIQGDGVDVDSLPDMLYAIKGRRWSADNIAFGSGGGLLQKLNRDTQRFAFKASAIEVGGIWRDVFKAPATDPSKASKRGRLTLIKRDGEFHTVDESFNAKFEHGVEDMHEVFKNGAMYNDQEFGAIRARAALPSK